MIVKRKRASSKVNGAKLCKCLPLFFLIFFKTSREYRKESIGERKRERMSAGWARGKEWIRAVGIKGVKKGGSSEYNIAIERIVDRCKKKREKKIKEEEKETHIHTDGTRLFNIPGWSVVGMLRQPVVIVIPGSLEYNDNFSGFLFSCVVGTTLFPSFRLPY